MNRLSRGVIPALILVLVMYASQGCGTPKHAEENQHEGEQEANTVHLTQAQQQLVNLELAEVTERPWEERLAVTGQIAQDTDRLVYVAPAQSGILKELLVRVGDRIEVGQPVALVEVTGSTPELLEVPAPTAGLVITSSMKEGVTVDTLSSLVTVADLSQVWATFDVYEQDIGHVQLGQRVDVKSIAYPDETFSGTISFISPRVDETSRTIKIRALVENPDYKLKLGMFITGELIETSEESVLVIPDEAVATLNETTVVFVAVDTEKFAARAVAVGRTSNSQTEIRQGLSAGERIVTHGAFQLKSELLKETFEAGHAH